MLQTDKPLGGLVDRSHLLDLEPGAIHLLQQSQQLPTHRHRPVIGGRGEEEEEEESRVMVYDPEAHLLWCRILPLVVVVAWRHSKAVDALGEQGSEAKTDRLKG